MTPADTKTIGLALRKQLDKSPPRSPTATMTAQLLKLAAVGELSIPNTSALPNSGKQEPAAKVSF